MKCRSSAMNKLLYDGQHSQLRSSNWELYKHVVVSRVTVVKMIEQGKAYIPCVIRRLITHQAFHHYYSSYLVIPRKCLSQCALSNLRSYSADTPSSAHTSVAQTETRKNQKLSWTKLLSSRSVNSTTLPFFPCEKEKSKELLEIWRKIHDFMTFFLKEHTIFNSTQQLQKKKLAKRNRKGSKNGF